MTGSVTSATDVGGRLEQEDRYVAVEVDHDGRRCFLLAVFDGHSGAEASDRAAELLPRAWERASRDTELRTSVEAVFDVLREETADLTSGSSASVALVDGSSGRVVYGVLGDSPIVVRRDDGSCVISPVHNTATAPDDVAEAVERGAELVGPYLVDPGSGEGVNLTRTIGDAELTFLGRQPEVFEAELGEGSFVCVASDGVFNEVSSSPDVLARRIEELVSSGAEAADIVADALAHGGDDNVTVVLWRSAEVSGPERGAS